MKQVKVLGSCIKRFDALTTTIVKDAADTASIGACQSTINVYGSRAELNEHPDMVAVSLRNVALSPNAIGYGPGAGYLTELTVVDGV